MGPGHHFSYRLKQLLDDTGASALQCLPNIVHLIFKAMPYPESISSA